MRRGPAAAGCGLWRNRVGVGVVETLTGLPPVLPLARQNGCPRAALYRGQGGWLRRWLASCGCGGGRGAFRCGAGGWCFRNDRFRAVTGYLVHRLDQVALW